MPDQASRLRAVLFDMDDTIYDHNGAAHDSLHQALAMEPAFARAGHAALLAEYHFVLEELHIEVAAGRRDAEAARVERWRRLLERFGGDASRAAEIGDAVRAAYLRCERLVPGVQALIAALRRHGLRLALVSNNLREEQIGKLERFGLAEHFDAVVVSADHGVAKPDPRLFAIALDALGVSAREAVYVGDNYAVDVTGALAAGIRPVWFNRFDRAPSAGPEVAQLAALSPLDHALRILLGGARS